MYKSLEQKVLADEEKRKAAERERRVSLGLPAEEKKPLWKRVLGRGRN